MKSTLAIACLTLGIALAPVAGQAADSDTDRSRPMTFVKDSAITAKIKAKLTAEKPSNLTNVKVDTDRDGAVYLSGRVNSQTDAERAITLARETEGVTTVKSDLQVRKDR